MSYDAFGNEKSSTGMSDMPFRYCGEFFDGANGGGYNGGTFSYSGTYYLRMRSYNPKNGRFTTMDPARDGLNWYAYCGYDPVNKKDPTGLIVTEWDIDNLSSYDLERVYQLTYLQQYGPPCERNRALIDEYLTKIVYMRPYEYINPKDPNYGSLAVVQVDVGRAIEYLRTGSVNYDGVFAAGLIIANLDSPAPGPADLVGLGVIIVGAAVVTIMNASKDNRTVSQVLKGKRGTIKQAPLPPGFPGWEAIGPLTMAEIEKLARNNAPGFKEILKLLRNIRFNK